MSDAWAVACLGMTLIASHNTFTPTVAETESPHWASGVACVAADRQDLLVSGLRQDDWNSRPGPGLGLGLLLVSEAQGQNGGDLGHFLPMDVCVGTMLLDMKWWWIVSQWGSRFKIMKNCEEYIYIYWIFSPLAQLNSREGDGERYIFNIK